MVFQEEGNVTTTIENLSTRTEENNKMDLCVDRKSDLDASSSRQLTRKTIRLAWTEDFILDKERNRFDLDRR